MNDNWQDRIFSIDAPGFEDLALNVFRHQYENNSLYRSYADLLGRTANNVTNVLEIPFLPIRFFKSHSVRTGQFEPEVIFESSGTTNMVNSHHEVKDMSLYTESFLKGFTLFYGDPSDWCIIGLLPAYLERKGSSLVHMVDALVKRSAQKESGFYLYEFSALRETLLNLERKKQKTLLIGVSFALLDFANEFPVPLSSTVVMETGGMKGRKKEMLREELHAVLCHAFEKESIHSEYGMTELLSQAYSKGGGIFQTPPWMRIVLRDEEDPLVIKTGDGDTGVINVIDLANIHSCSFIATDDAGRLHKEGFEVLGRTDGSDLRGCSLLVLNS
jgi:hypothetical protein